MGQGGYGWKRSEEMGHDGFDTYLPTYLTLHVVDLSISLLPLSLSLSLPSSQLHIPISLSLLSSCRSLLRLFGCCSIHALVA